MGFKKYDGSAWQSINPKKLKGIPYTGTLPAVITGTKAGYLQRYKIYGNTEQASGTPTPENPIVPSECGERTENLFDFNRQRSDIFSWDLTKYIYGAKADKPTPESQYISEFEYNDDSFTVLTTTGGAGIGFLVEVKPNTTYTIYYQCDVTIPNARTSAAVNLITSNGTFGTYWGIYGNDRSSTFTTNADTAYVYVVFRAIGLRATYSSIMLTEGSATPTSYIPYGYKLTLTSAGQDVDIYLGESQTTRRIKKLVFDGTENWRTVSSPNYTYAIPITPYLVNVTAISSHFIQRRTLPTLTNKTFMLANSDEIYIKYNNKTSVNDFKQFLAQQYTNGTPVTVWYVLATEETGTLNEPLRKIGDYVDAIDSTQTTVQIPTTAGSTTVSWAGEGLAPSQFESIQEWVAAQTYTRINGAWVADN